MKVQMLKIVGWGLFYLFLLEVGLEVRAHWRGFDTILFGSFQRRDSEGAGAAMAKSEQGSMLSARRSTDKKPHEVRYWIASSSHAEDSYLARELVFPSRLETLLRESGLPATVINASHAGMDIAANRTDLETRGAQLKPDVAILYQMSLQISDLSKKLLGGRRSDLSRGRRAEGSSAKPDPNWVVRVFEETSLYAQLKGNVSNRLTGQRVLADSLGSEGEKEFDRLVRGFIHAARQVGAEPVLCTFATSHQRAQIPNIPPEVEGFLYRYNVYLSLDGWFDTIEQFNRRLKQIAGEEHLRLIDLDTEMSGHSQYFRDFVHFTPAGHDRVARIIFARLGSPDKTLSASMAETR
jgi:hypothetical protein